MSMKCCDHKSHKTNAHAKVDACLALLREMKIRVTTQRKDVLEVLANQAKPLSSEEVFTILREGDLVTVYRSLTTLEECGILRRTDFGDGIRRYEIADPDHHHHYVRCRNCGALEALASCFFDDTISKLLAKKGYKNIQHQLDILALCATCQ